MVSLEGYHQTFVDEKLGGSRYGDSVIGSHVDAGESRWGAIALVDPLMPSTPWRNQSVKSATCSRRHTLH
jgi:hypothetical protein